MRSIPVHAAQPYEVLIERGILSRAGELTGRAHSPCKVALITDSTVERLYGSIVARSYQEAGFEVSCFAFPQGEISKNLRTYESILNFLADSGVTRGDLIVALGGGVVGDLAGFAAASYLRGIDFVQIPTTYLAAVDSSVGGKTGLNLNAGKNLCGAFHQPLAVFIDCDVFNTLPEKRFGDGVAETIKYGVIADEALFEIMERDFLGTCVDEVVLRCIQIKAQFVAEDEFDNGTRRLLNFGHTFGHAIERCSDYRITHGYAVGIGMLMAAKAAQELDYCNEECVRRIANTLESHRLPLQSEYSAEELATAMLGDKKRKGDTLTFILPQQIGQCQVHDVPVSELPAFVSCALEVG